MMQGLRRSTALALALVMALAYCACAFAEDDATYRAGDQSKAIKAVKLRLYELGYFDTDNLSVKYTDATVEAVRTFQQQNGLAATGEMDPATRAAIYADTAQPYTKPPPMPMATPYVDYPERDADGYLPGAGEYVYENDDAGIWVYLTNTLQITIHKHSDPSVPLEWFETDIKLRGDERIMSVENNPDRPGTRFNYPYIIAQRNRYILGFSDDFYGHRINRGERIGVVIRNGEIIGNKTHSRETHYLPNLDVMAQYPDGSLMVYECNEHTAEELLEMGAINTFCFGPIVVRDGEIGALVEEGWFETKSPRQALGMYEPGHYLLVSVCGRMKTSIGCGLKKVAELMLSRGVTQALNLDGGNTMALVFRGRMLNKLATWKNKKFVRTVTSLIGVGLGDYEVD